MIDPVCTATYQYYDVPEHSSANQYIYRYEMVEFGIYRYVMVHAGIFLYKHPCTVSRLFILFSVQGGTRRYLESCIPEQDSTRQCKAFKLYPIQKNSKFQGFFPIFARIFPTFV